MDSLLYRAEDAARVLGIGRSKTYELIAAGELRSVQIGRLRRIPRAGLEADVERLQQTATPAA